MQEDSSPTIPTCRKKEEKGKTVEDKKWSEQLGQYRGIGPALETRQSPPSNTGSARSFQRDTERGIKVLQYCEVLQRGGA